ncbi:tetratricopeptide repeat protein [Rhodocyclaceae bacterium SMB388]
MRESKWESHTEKHSNLGLRPFRCVGCSHRFLAPAPGRSAGVMIAMGGAAAFALLLLAMIVTFTIRPDSDRERSPKVVDAYAILNAETLQAAEDGNAEAQFRVGKKLLLEAALDGQKAPVALVWLHKAAENGHAAAMIQLGRMYRTGVGALQNYDIAVEWILRAAHAEDPEGMLELGRFYRDGVGVDKDPINGYVWMNRAAASHHLEAARERETLARSMSPGNLRQAQRLSLEPFSPDDGIKTSEIAGQSLPPR